MSVLSLQSSVLAYEPMARLERSVSYPHVTQAGAVWAFIVALWSAEGPANALYYSLDWKGIAP